MAATQEAVVINMGDPHIGQSDATPTKKKQDTLFGPNIGIVAKGPEWTEMREKAVDELTPDVVRGWIAKSKEVRSTSMTQIAVCAARCIRHWFSSGKCQRPPPAQPHDFISQPLLLPSVAPCYGRACAVGG